jgi:hypothetical protein
MGGNVMHAMTGMSGMSGLSGLGSAVAWSPLSLPAGLLRQYALDGGASYEASPLNGLPMLRSLEPYGTYRQPRQGRAWLFDGTNDIATGPSIASVLGANPRSFCIRALATGSSNQCLMAAGSFALFGYFGLTLNSGSWTLNASGSLLNTGVANDSLIHTHVVTYDGSAIRWFLDGVLIGSPNTVALNTEASSVTIGARAVNDFFLNGRVERASIFSRVLSGSEIASYGTSGIDGISVTGLQAHYECNEESGLIGFDISGNGNHLTLTNITQSTFHTTNSGVTRNRNNLDGYRLSSGVFIPKRLTDANAADGNPLTVTGRSPYPISVEPPCITGDGSTARVTLPVQIPGSADFSIAFNYFHVTNDTTSRALCSNRFNAPPGFFSITGNQNASAAAEAAALNFIVFQRISGNANGIIAITNALTAGAWHRVTFSRVGSTVTGTCTVFGGSLLSVSGTLTGDIDTSVSVFSFLQGFALGTIQSNNGSVSDFSIITGGVTTHYPMQDGAGTGSTNRNLSFIRSDGTFGVAADAVVNGTVSTIWANRCPHARDWCIEFGGDIAANGAFLPGQISGSLASDGTAKTRVPGKFGNPYSRINFNPHNAAELNGLGLANAYAVGAARQSVAPIDTKFRRTRTDGDDRFLATSTALTGIDKTNVEGYVS